MYAIPSISIAASSASAAGRGVIAATRLGLRHVYHPVMQSDDVRDRIHLVDVYGRASHRLSRLLKLEGAEHTRLEAILNDLIDEVTAEVADEFGLVLAANVAAVMKDLIDDVTAEVPGSSA